MPAPIVTGPKSYFPSILAKYGKPIGHWMAILAAEPDLKHMEQVEKLKALGLGHGHANALVAVFRVEGAGPWPAS